MEPEIGLDEKSRRGVVDILNQLLADEYVLYTKTRNFHWNVVGPHFDALHKFFEAQYDELEETIDEVAERARALGGRAAGSLAEFLELTRLQEAGRKAIDSDSMLLALADDHEKIIRGLRVALEICAERFSDAGTSDFLTGLMEQHEKMAWMLRAHVTTIGPDSQEVPVVAVPVKVSA